MGSLMTAIYTLGYFLYARVTEYPKLKDMSKEERIDFVRTKISRNIGKNVLKGANAKVEVVYEDKEEFDSLRKDEPIVIIANHQSNYDIAAIQAHFPIPVGFVAKKEMEKWPFYGLWMTESACVFLDRKNPREGIKDMRRATSLIKDGYPMVIFPEGTRSPDGEIHEFKKGSFKIATDSKGKIIPLTIKGTYDIQRKGSSKIQRNKIITLVVGKVIDTKELDRPQLKGLNIEVENIIRETFKK